MTSIQCTICEKIVEEDIITSIKEHECGKPPFCRSCLNVLRTDYKGEPLRLYIANKRLDFLIPDFPIENNENNEVSINNPSHNYRPLTEVDTSKNEKNEELSLSETALNHNIARIIFGGLPFPVL